MEGPYHTHVGSIQHPQGKMVCQHCWLFRIRRLQTVATLGHIKGQHQEERSWWSVQGLHWDPRSLNVPLELHQQDVQQHQTGRTWNDRSTRPTYQDICREMWLHGSQRKEDMLERTTLPCNKTLWSQEVGQITDNKEGDSHLWQAATVCQRAWGNSQGLQLTQVQWRTCNGNHHRRDQILQIQER